LKIAIVWGLGIILTVAFVAIVFAARGRHSDQRTDDRWPLYAKKLLNEREQVLYWRLMSAFPDCIILAQVSLAQLLAFEKGSQNRQAR